MQLRAQGYTRTSSRPRNVASREAAFATTPGHAPPPRRGGLVRSLLVASALGAATGAALLTWDYYDPASAAPAKKIAYDSLDATLSALHQARDVAQPYVDQLLAAIDMKTPAVRAPAATPAAGHRVAHQPVAPEVPAAAVVPAAVSATTAGKEESEEEEKRAKVILLEGVKNVQEDDDDDDDDDVDAVVTSDDDGATKPLSKIAPHVEAAAGHAAQPSPVLPDHEAELERRRAAEEAELRQRLEEEERRAEAEAARRREEKRRAEEEEERREQEERERREREEREQREREARVAAATEHLRQDAARREEKAKRQEEAPRPAEAKADAESVRKGVREQMAKRREQTDKMRLAALAAKQKREEAELAKRREAIPPRLLSPAANPEHPAPAHPESAPKPAAHAAAAPVHTPAPAAAKEEKKTEEEASTQAALTAAAEKARKEEQEKFAKLMQEKERLVSRVHIAEAEAYAATWRKSATQAFEAIAHEMASRKYMNTADFAHLSAIFTGYISLKNALDKEQPFTSELQALKRAIHDDLAHQVIDSIPKSAASGVPTLQRIMTSFEQQVVPSVRQVAFTANDDADYPMPVQHLRRTFAWYVLGSLRVKSPEEVAAPATTTYGEAERALAFTHEALNKGDLMSALQHIRRLPAGPVASIGASWAQGLNDRLVVEQATTIFDALIPPAK